LETALLDRARSLGVKFFAGKTVVDAVKLDTGKVELTIDGAKDKAYVDLVVVAAGAGFARASASSLNAEKLGFEIVKMEARDFAVTGVYEPTSEDKNTGPKNVGGVGWSYGFDAPDVKYLVAQISEEQFEEFQRDPTKLAGYVREAAIRQNIGDREYKKTPTGREVKPGFFPIEVQQAQGMTSKKSGAVLVGDSAATPHPSTAKGLNTGSREIDYISDLVSGRDGETEDEALSSYDWETTRATNVMVAAAMASMASEAKARCTKTIARTLAKAAISTPPEFDDARKLLKRVEAEVVIPLGEACKTDDGSNDWALTSRNIKRLREIEKPLAVIFDMASKPDPKPQEIEKLLRPLLV
jgi:2-polyprenyl-6-methoxyphenol hydroxylase-like FAD-dependent oxidoreductase